MQQLQLEFKNVPTDVQSLQVCSSTNSELNRDQSLSVQNKVLDCNNLDGVQLKQASGLKVNVLVLSKQGKPLMPCSCSKARKLLKGGRAKIIKRIPFTIQLNFECENKTQDVTLGIDSGYKHMGFSCTTDKRELVSAEIQINDRTKKHLENKRIYRKNRRYRLWYRKPRFSNRKRKEGWLPPSTQRNFDIHLNLINRIKKVLPITKTIIEVGKFDIAKLDNLEIQGIQYQQGTLYQYRNRIAYLLAREHGKCQYCGEKHKENDGWRLHHIYGHDHERSSDWALVHENCHHELHEKHFEYKLRDKPSESFKDSTFMNIIRCRFIKLGYDVTYGYETYQKRIELGLEKSHINDAFVISGTNQVRCRPFHIERKRRHNRCLQLNRKKFKRSIRTHIYKIQPKDLIWYEKKQYRVIGIMTRGRYVKVENYTHAIVIKKIEKIYNFHGFAWQLI